MDRQQYLAHTLKLMASKETAMASDAKNLLQKQASLAASTFELNGKESAIDALASGVDDWLVLLTAHYSTTIKIFSHFTLEQLELAQKSDFERYAEQFIMTEALTKAKGLHKTTTDQFVDIITNGQVGGMSIDEISEDIYRALGGNSAKARAQTIARTEVHNAATYAQQMTAESLSRPLIREWVSASDSRTRDDHRDADDQRRGLNEPFLIGGESIGRPGEGICMGCRYVSLRKVRGVRCFLR